MASKYLLLSGHVTRNDNHQGIHGIRVEAWDAAQSDKEPLGVALTNRDGSYRIELPATDCCDCPEVFVKLRDRDCRLIHDGCKDRRCCKPGALLVVDVAVAPQALWWHLARPLSWTPIDEPLLPVYVMQEIEDALEVLHADASTLQLANCVTPSIEIFDRVLHDAWDTLQGDAAAARRYRDVLDLLCGSGEHKNREFKAQVKALFAGACDEDDALVCKEPEPCAPCAPDECAADACDCGEPFIANDKALLLAMAALHVACGDERKARRYVQVLLNQLCRFETLGALHAAARQALLGDANAKAHARDLLELLCTLCSAPKDRAGCTPRHPPACCVPCLSPALERCLREAVVRWCRVRCWRICEVRPPRACAGDEILIIGCGFGDRPGRVRFGNQGPNSTLPSIDARQWCDDRISVVVPQGAGCGVALELPPQTLKVCDRFLELRPVGCIDHGFEGTAAQILRFDVKGHASGECPQEPGVPLRIRWNTCAADHVRIELVDLANNSVVAALDPAPADGRWDFTGTDFKRTVRLRVRIVASGRCQPPQVSRQIDLVFQKRPNLRVQGLEVTQAIQFYRADQHLTDAADRGPDNSVRLVTNKTAWARAYLRSGQDPAFDNGQLAGVDGTLRVERRVGGVWGTVATLAPQNGPRTAEDIFASYDAERGAIDTTLNFVVPANLMTGLLRFTVDVASPFGNCPGNHASGSTQVDVNLQQTLNAAFITIGYNGRNATNTGNIVLAAPTLAQCQAETSWAMTTYPVSGAPNVRLGGTVVTTTPLDDARSCAGCCSPNWQPLLQQVAALVALDQAANPGQWVYYGLVAGGIPVNVPGCNGWGATGGLAGQPVTYAHEMGHQFGLPHARCGNAGSGNAAYPIYEPYDLPVDPPGTTNWTMASIGEYGLDINSGAIANPSSAEDFMSYCSPRWVSLFTTNYLTNIAGLSPVTVPSGSGAAEPRVIEDTPNPFARDERAIEPLIHMLGIIGTDGAVTVSSVARIDTRYLRGEGRRTPYRAQLIDADGAVLAEDVVYAYRIDGGKGGGCGCGGGCGGSCGGSCDDDEPQPLLVKAMLADRAPGSALRIVKRGETVWEREGAAKPPAISGARAALDTNGDLQLSWQIGAAAEREVEVWVRWTADDGKTWHALTVGLHGDNAIIAADQLPAGDVCFELLAHDGFYTVRAATDAVALPAKPPVVTILYPAAGARVYGDRLIHLWGTASSAAGATIDAQSAAWFIDGEPVGYGLDLWVDNPGAGRHCVRLQVAEGKFVGEATSEIEVLGDPEPQPK